ncbi:MAG: helix-turn-helix domain-containing protein [Clostridia bacterium]|nr:helix-turn-helix domain-containing protein [Clostridia bacterium]
MDTNIYDIHTADVDALFDAILSLDSREECYKFFEDALTSREILDVAQRLRAARMLKDGRSYSEVCAATGMSTATISRVSKALERGAGGYAIALSRLEAAEEEK